VIKTILSFFLRVKITAEPLFLFLFLNKTSRSFSHYFQYYKRCAWTFRQSSQDSSTAKMTKLTLLALAVLATFVGESESAYIRHTPPPYNLLPWHYGGGSHLRRVLHPFLGLPPPIYYDRPYLFGASASHNVGGAAHQGTSYGAQIPEANEHPQGVRGQQESQPEASQLTEEDQEDSDLTSPYRHFVWVTPLNSHGATCEKHRFLRLTYISFDSKIHLSLR
jgi:hypothetical protein